MPVVGVSHRRRKQRKEVGGGQTLGANGFNPACCELLLSCELCVEDSPTLLIGVAAAATAGDWGTLSCLGA